MKPTTVVVVSGVFLFMAASAPIHAAVDIRGMSSCGSWIENRTESRVATEQTLAFRQRSWLLGYLSGMAIGMEKDVLKGTDNASLFLWMDNWCRANPLKDIEDGGQILFFELKKQKRL